MSDFDKARAELDRLFEQLSQAAPNERRLILNKMARILGELDAMLNKTSK